MSILDKRIAIAVYLPREREGTLEELLRAGGLTPTETDKWGWLYARWDAANLISTEAKLFEQEFHRKIWITFLEGEWLEHRPEPDDEDVPQEADGGMALIYALRDLCIQLEPDVAMFLSHRWQDRDWLELEEWAVVTNAAGRLLHLYAGALYVNDWIAGIAKRLRNATQRFADRERIDVPKGLMTLAGQGWGRFA